MSFADILVNPIAKAFSLPSAIIAWKQITKQPNELSKPNWHYYQKIGDQHSLSIFLYGTLLNFLVKPGASGFIVDETNNNNKAFNTNKLA
jgi:hypothetical protein